MCVYLQLALLLALLLELLLLLALLLLLWETLTLESLRILKKKREEALALTHARTHAAKFEDALTHARTHAAKFEDVAAKLERELKQLVEAKKESDAALERARALVLSLLALLVR